jgi:hypothetical protein
MTGNRLPPLTVLAFPVFLTIGIIIIPVVADYSNHQLALEAAAYSTRWFWGHIIAAVAFGLSIPAAYCVDPGTYVSGKRKTASPAIIFITVGAVLHAAGMGADGIGPLAVAASGGDAGLFFEGSGKWITGVFVSAAIFFGIGLIIQTALAIRSGLISGKTKWLVLIASILFIGAEALPTGWGLYLVAAMSLLIYVPVGFALWKQK